MSAKKNHFKTLVENTNEINRCFQEGLKALGKYSKKIQVEDTSKICGSIDLDYCMSDNYPHDSRWDYIICYDGKLFFVEVHSAYTGEVTAVIKKLQWLKDWLNQKAPELKSLRFENNPYYWIQSDGYHIAKNSKQEKLLIQNGLKPIAKLKLPIK